MKIKRLLLSALVPVLFLTLGIAADPTSQATPLSSQEVMTDIGTTLGETAQQTRIEQLTVDHHPVILIGEKNHNDPKYRHLSNALQQKALEQQIALFKEALPRNANVESTWSQLIFKTKDSGYLFGAEDDLAYLISDWVIDLSRFRFSGGVRTADQNDNFRFKFVLSAKAMPIWTLFVQHATTPPFDEMTQILNPQLQAFMDTAIDDELLAPTLKGDFSPAQWAMLDLALLQIASYDSDLPDAQKDELKALLKDPMNPNTLIAFNDSFDRHYRSARMAANIRETLPQIPSNVPVVIQIGEGHLNDVLQDLKAPSPL